MIKKLRAKQRRRYMQSSNEDEFNFSDSPPTSINKRQYLQYIPSIYELAISIYEIVRVIIRIMVIELSTRESIRYRCEYIERASFDSIYTYIYLIYSKYIWRLATAISRSCYSISSILNQPSTDSKVRENPGREATMDGRDPTSGEENQQHTKTVHHQIQYRAGEILHSQQDLTTTVVLHDQM